MYSLLVRDLVRAELPGRARLLVMILVLVILAAAPLHSSTSWVLNQNGCIYLILRRYLAVLYNSKIDNADDQKTFRGLEKT